MAYTTKGWTYGAEHELVDWPRDRPLPAGCTSETNEYTIVNSNGIATDPTLRVDRRLYHFGGEVNTPPTDTAGAQVEILGELLRTLPEAVVNYRSELNIHIRVPGLRDDLAALRRLAAFNAHWMPQLLPVIDPLPRPLLIPRPLSALDFVEHEGALRNWRTRRKFQHVVLPLNRTSQQMKATTTTEFFEAEVPRTANSRTPMWHAQPRAAVNVRQLLQTDTVEFRHFAGTLDLVKMGGAIQWCRAYLECALCPDLLFRSDLISWADEHAAAGLVIPQMPYCHWQEQRYRATCHDGTNKRDDISHNIRLIEEGLFDAYDDAPRTLPLKKD